MSNKPVTPICDEQGEFRTGDNDLDDLLNFASDMARGNANMDTGLWFMAALERVRVRLAAGVQAVPAAKVSRVRCSATNLRGGNCGCAFGQCKKGNIL